MIKNNTEFNIIFDDLDNKISNDILYYDDINKKRFSIYDTLKPFLDDNEFKQNINVCDEILDLTKYIILGTLDIGKCKKNIKIICSNTKLSNIICFSPDIILKELRCVSNNLTEFDNAKLNNLVHLFCGYNKIKNLDKLSQNVPNLKYLNCAGNPIISLDNLPEKLIYLNCENCKISNLNNLPMTLEILVCSHNPISLLDYLPDSIIELCCVGCEITYLDNLPSSVIELSCYSNKITQLLNLPKNLRLIKCEEKIQLLECYNNLEIIYF